MQQVPGNKTAPAKKHDKSQAGHHGRRHGWQQGHDLEKTFPGHVRIVDGIGKNKTDNDGRSGSRQGRQQRVGKGLDKFFTRQGFYPVGRRRYQQQFKERINNKETKDSKDHQDADQQRRFPKEQF